jgi:hypothetical protein
MGIISDNLRYSLLPQPIVETVDLQGQNPPGYIPISLNLTMEGLAGMRLFNKFTISEEYLPFSYRKQFDFIVKGYNSRIKRQLLEYPN